MKILIIGQSVVDNINENGKLTVKSGGIHYSVAGISSFIESDDEVYLCTSISKKDKYLFKEFYRTVKNDFIEYRDNIPTVNLTIHKNKERDERYSHITQNLNLPVDVLNNFEGIFINMITGFDITLEQLNEIRKNYKGIIYFDVHTFSRGLDEDGNRRFRKIPEFKKWAEQVNIVQVNEEELKTLTDKTSEREIVKEVLSYGVKQVIITKAEKGARLYHKPKGELESVYVSAIDVETKNKVGCGDVFGAVYFYNYIRTKDVNKSLKLANTAAGCSAGYSEINEFKKLKRDVQQQYY